VTEGEFLERFDRHLARIDAHIEVSKEHMARGNQLMEGVRVEMSLTREEIERSREAHVDLRVFTRDITLRNERIWREVMGGLSDLRDEVKANTAATLSVLDRLQGQEG
jgi:hypothetical protein